MFEKFSISGINALPRFGKSTLKDISIQTLRPLSEQLSLYIHIPFCKSICHFCMLRRGAKAVNEVPNEYVDSIIKEIELHIPNISDTNINSVYIGGGTPSMLKPSQIEKLISFIRRQLNVKDNVEFTFEGESQTLGNLSLLSALSNNGISRISFGLQTFNLEIRELLGREDSISDIENLFLQLCKFSFKEINIDYIYNLPNSDVEFISKDFEKLREFSPSSIDCHPLKYVSCSKKLLNTIVERNMRIPTGQERIKMFNYIRSYLLKESFNEQFTDQYSLYSNNETNQYMRNLYGLDGGEYLGIGPGSRSHFGDWGFTKVQGLDSYMKDVFNESIPIEKTTSAPLVDNYIACFPKRNDKLSISAIEKSADKDYYFNKLELLASDGYVNRYDDYFLLTDTGLNWYQNLQEILLSPKQKENHLATIAERSFKFREFGDYFSNVGEVLC